MNAKKRKMLALLGGALLLIAAGAALRFGPALAGIRVEAARTPSPADERPTVVAVSTVVAMPFEQRVAAAGSLQAKRFALVSARMPGPLDEVFVDEGDVVEAGKTELFQTDSLKLHKALLSAQEGLAVADAMVAEKEANLERVAVELEQAEADLQRYRDLVQRNALSQQQYEHQQSAVRQAAAMVRHAEALIDLSKAQREQARLALTMAEKDLSDSRVVAPLSGKVAQRLMEPGEMAGAGTPVLRIEDLSLLEATVFLPEEHYAQVEAGRTRMRIRVGDAAVGVFPVSYKSPTVHPRLRTFEVKCLIETPPPGIVPGRLIQAEVLLASRTALGVPSDAILVRGGQHMVFVVDGDRARAIPVETGLEMGGFTEVRADLLGEGAAVVVAGQHLLDDGRLVRLLEEAPR